VDFSQWPKFRHKPVGIDLTEAGIQHTKARLETIGITNSEYSLLVADAEYLPFQTSQFDLVYAWGVFHHSPNTDKCFHEAFRVLKPGGTLKAMIYHTPSWTGLMLWLRYALLTGKIVMSLKEVAFKYLESPGTKIYSVSEGRKLVCNAGFVDICLSTQLSPGNLLSIRPSHKYQSLVYRLIWKIYPRSLVKLLGNRLGSYLLIRAKKLSK